MNKNSHKWLFGRWTDLLVLFVPVWVVWVICFQLPSEVVEREVPLWVWVVIVIGIDVSHVWTTIYRTYLDKEEFNNHKRLLLYAPVIVFVFFYSVAAISQTVFWTILAYLALYHFVKQQYGFLRLYKSKFGRRGSRSILKDEWMIYLSMLYPVLYWHFSPARDFEWFVEGDFLLASNFLSASLFHDVTAVANIVYWLLIGAWVLQEILSDFGNIPVGKILWLVTTAGNWYIGIIYFNSDLVFTVTNVVAHGIPYIALVFFYVERKKEIKQEKRLSPGKLISHIGVMLLGVLVLAFGEEYLWDMFLYRDNEAFFGTVLPFFMEAFSNKWAQAFAFALLTIPQATHYILDGFIWKGNAKNPYLKKVLIK